MVKFASSDEFSRVPGEVLETRTSGSNVGQMCPGVAEELS